MTEALRVDPLTEDQIRSAGLQAWLEQRKLDDLATFLDLPFPDSNRDEDWRRTDVSGIDPRAYGLPDSPGPAADAGAELAAQGVVVSSLEAAAQSHSELVQRYLEHEVVPAAAGKFAALNAAFWRGGVFVHVPRGVTATIPVRAVFGPPLGVDGPQAILPRSLVVVEDGASLVYTCLLYTSDAADE